jgi:hypothetical protein
MLIDNLFMGAKVCPKVSYNINAPDIIKKSENKKRGVFAYKNATPKAISILIPSNLDIRKLLVKYPPTLKACVNSIHQQEDKVATIASLLVKAINKNIQMANADVNDFAPLSSTVLQHHVRDYNDYLSYLLELGVIETDGVYIKDEKCTGFRFTDGYRYVPLKEHYITDYNGNDKKGAAVYNSFFRLSKDQRNTIEKYNALYDDLRSVTVTDYDDAKLYITKDLKQLAKESVLKDFKEKRNGIWTRYKNATKEDHLLMVKSYAIAKQNSWIASLHEIDNKHLYFKQDRTSSRIHTSVLGVKTECRHLLRLVDKEIVSCDLKNSQPFISSILFTECAFTPEIETIIHQCLYNLKSGNNTLYKSIIKRIALFKTGDVLPSTRKYIQLVQQGELYEYLAININQILNERGRKHKELIRDDGKKQVFTLFFNPTKYNSLARDIFRCHFPEVMSLFEDINSLFTHTRKESTRFGIPRSHNNLAILLQSIESHIFIDTICKDIKDIYSHVPLLTLHDAIATIPEYADLIKEEMEMALTNNIGIVPTIKLEQW